MIPNGEGLLPLQSHASDKKTLRKLLRMSDQRISLQAFNIAKVISTFYHKILTKKMIMKTIVKHKIIESYNKILKKSPKEF